MDFFPGCVEEKLYRIVSPDDLVYKLLNYYHCAIAGGYQGVIKTYCKIKQIFYWSEMQKNTSTNFLIYVTQAKKLKKTTPQASESKDNSVEKKMY